jgi:tetratricopeptide (TPR) repeat protein
MEQLEKIIKYLDGELIGEEKQTFEQELENNLSLKQTIALVKEVDQTLSDENLLNYVDELKKVQANVNAEMLADTSGSEVMDNSHRHKIWPMHHWKMLAAASITLFITVSLFFYMNYSKPLNDKVFNRFYERYEASLLTRSAVPSDVNDLIKAIQLYDKGDYTDAIAQFELIIKKDATNTAAHFFIGVSFIETKNFSKAIENLSFVIAQNDTAFIEHAEWYLALCYIKTNQINCATVILNKIANGKTYYKLPANDVLKSLK